MKYSLSVIISVILLAALIGTSIDLYYVGREYFKKEFLPNMLFLISRPVRPNNKELEVENENEKSRRKEAKSM